MSKLEDILKKSDNDLNDIVESLLKQIRIVEPKLFNSIVEIFDYMDIKGGKISTTKKAIDALMMVEKLFNKTFKKYGYYDSVKSFGLGFDLVTENNIAQYEALKIGRISSSQISPIKKEAVSQVIDSLTGNGMYENFVKPIRKALYKNIVFGASVSETIEDLQQYIGGKDSQMQKYVGQVATDSIQQYDGMVNQTYKNEFELGAIRYVGSIIETSRGQCVKWVKMGTLTDEQIKEELKWVKKASFYETHKVSGMIPDTTIKNFLINRGGFNCRHRAFGVKIKKT